MDSRQRRDPAATGRRHGGDAVARRRLPHCRHRQVGPRHAGHDRAAGQEGVRVPVRLSRSPARAPPVHRSSVSQLGACGDRSDARLRQRSVHARSRGVHHPCRPEAILSLSELHRPSRRAARARRFDGAASREISARDAVRQRRRRRPADRRDSGWRIARLPFAADAARGVRRDDHPDGSRHRAINGPPRRAQDRSADAHPVHERQRSAPAKVERTPPISRALAASGESNATSTTAASACR